MPTNEVLEIKDVKIGANEFLLLNLVLVLKSKAAKIFIPIGLLIVVYYAFNTDLPAGILAIGISLITILPLTVFFNSRKTHKSDPWISQSLSYSFSHKTIYVHSENFDTKMEWSNIAAIQETKAWYLFFTEENRGLLIPKNRIQPAETEALLRELILSKSQVTQVELR